MQDRSQVKVGTLGKYKKVIDIWFRLISNILEDDQLTRKLWNTLKLILGNK